MRIDADDAFAHAIRIILEISCPEMVDDVASSKYEDRARKLLLRMKKRHLVLNEDYFKTCLLKSYPRAKQNGVALVSQVPRSHPSFKRGCRDDQSNCAIGQKLFLHRQAPTSFFKNEVQP